jgi:drug/metabolite transporter (DMT)-like permease
MGIGLVVLSMFLFSCLYAFYKACSPYLSTPEIIFFQALGSWILVLPWALKEGARGLMSPQLGKIVLRTLCGLSGLLCITFALRQTGLAAVILLNNSAPLFVPLVLWLWLRTKISGLLWVSLGLGFLGIFVIVRPGFETVNFGLLLAVLSGIFSALLLVITKFIAHEPLSRILFYYFLLLWGLLFPFVFSGVPNVPAMAWLWLVCAAFSSIGAQLSFTKGMRYATSQQVAPFIYTSVIFSGFIDWIVWGERIDFWTGIGMVIVCLGSILSIQWTRKK